MLKDINLLPDSIIYRKRCILIRFGKVFLLVIVILGFLALLMLRTYQRWNLEKQVAQLAASIETSSIKEVENLEKELDEVKRKYADVEAAAKKIPSRKIKTGELVGRLASHMPQSISLTNINFNAQALAVKMELSSSNRADIPIFLKRLHDDDLFADINISEIRKNGSIYIFSAELNIK